MDRIYYISQGATISEHLSNIENVCKAGVRIVQLRLKSISHKDYVSAANEAKKICNEFQTKLIINDNAQAALEAQADGVHLGQNDLKPDMAQALLKKEQLIGGTANTLEDCMNLISHGVDYIGLGPYAYTETKKKLSPFLGINGYQSIIANLKSKGFHPKIYAIGGIKSNDFSKLFDIGVYGIAISGHISNISTEQIKEITQPWLMNVSKKFIK